MPAHSNHLLCYRFADVGQLQKHLHLTDGRTLFFWRDDRGDLREGSRVLLEFLFGAGEQVSLVGGQVLARVPHLNGSTRSLGMWLEFPDSRLAKRAQQGLAALSARQQRRLGCDLMVEAAVNGVPFLGRVVDVSVGGCHLAGTPGLRPGAIATLRLKAPGREWPADLGKAEVVHGAGSDVGLRYLRADEAVNMGRRRLVELVQQQWSQARRLVHPVGCCSGVAGVIEPPLPRRRNLSAMH